MGCCCFAAAAGACACVVCVATVATVPQLTWQPGQLCHVCACMARGPSPKHLQERDTPFVSEGHPPGPRASARTFAHARTHVSRRAHGARHAERAQREPGARCLSQGIRDRSTCAYDISYMPPSPLTGKGPSSVSAPLPWQCCWPKAAWWVGRRTCPARCPGTGVGGVCEGTPSREGLTTGGRGRTRMCGTRALWPNRT